MSLRVRLVLLTLIVVTLVAVTLSAVQLETLVDRSDLRRHRRSRLTGDQISALLRRAH